MLKRAIGISLCWLVLLCGCQRQELVFIETGELALLPKEEGRPVITNNVEVTAFLSPADYGAIIEQVARVPELSLTLDRIIVDSAGDPSTVKVLFGGRYLLTLQKVGNNEWRISEGVNRIVH